MRTYLVVDDNVMLAENLAEIIRDAGDEAVVAHGGARALELARQQRFDALVTDMKMPVMNGAHLVHDLRRIDPGLPAIVVTAYTGDDDLAAARTEGLLAVLPKPVPIQRLLSLLASARRDGLVAIVEDDTELCDNLGELLRDRGFSAVTAGSVLETERLGPLTPFLALVDWRVPGGPDGAAYERLRAKFPVLRTFVISAYVKQHPPLDAAGTYQKPFETPVLLQAIEDAYSSRQVA